MRGRLPLMLKVLDGADHLKDRDLVDWRERKMSARFFLVYAGASASDMD